MLCDSCVQRGTQFNGPNAAAGNPVPVPTHISVPAAQLKPGRLILIGDIHGCCQELEQLLEACKFDPQTDNLVLLGDIVNKGPHSPQVGTHPYLRTTPHHLAEPASVANTVHCCVHSHAAYLVLIAGVIVGSGHMPSPALAPPARLDTKSTCLACMLCTGQVLALARQWQPWVVRGNHDDAALHAYYLRRRGDPDWDKPSWGWVADITAADAELLAQLPFSISFPDYGVLAVHAGLIPGQPVQQQLLSHLYKMRDVVQEPRGR